MNQPVSRQRVAVEGVVVRGHGVASGLSPSTPYPGGTIALQLPHFAARGLDLSSIHPATINVDITPCRLSILRPAHTFRDVQWTNLHGPETFSFMRCWLSRVMRPVGDGESATPPGSEDSHHDNFDSHHDNFDLHHPVAAASHDGWIYYPHPETKPMHEQPPAVLEVLMPLVPGLTYGDTVILHVDPEEILIE